MFVPGFLPSGNAPLFGNHPWPSSADVKVAIPGLPPVTIIGSGMGLCGGMAFMTRDIFEAGMPQLQSPSSSTLPDATVHYIQNRLIDSFSPAPQIPSKWLAWDAALDHDTIAFGKGTFGLSIEQAKGVMADVDAGHLCPLGIVMDRSLNPADVFNNHVELVYGYDLVGSELTLHVYDCNFPDRNDIWIKLDIASPTPALPITTNGTSPSGRIHGFFRLDYHHADPSPAYVDDSQLSLSVPPPGDLRPGSTTNVEIRALNVGSTTWMPTLGYRLGSQAPQDNTTWELSRVDSTAAVRPGATAVFAFDIKAPSAPGDYAFSWQMLREHVHWFGPATPIMQVPVGSGAPVCSVLAGQWKSLKAKLDGINQELAQIDWSNPVAARSEARALSAEARQVQDQIAAIESQQRTNGCAPGGSA